MRMKTILKTLILVSAVSLLTFATIIITQSNPQTTTIFISPTSSVVVFNQTFRIDVDISEATNIYGWEFRLGWNSSLLEAINVTEGDFLNSGGDTFKISRINNTAGELLVGCTLLENISGVNGNGTLATIYFQAENEGNTTLDLHGTKLVDPLLQLQDHTSFNGTIEVKPPSNVYVTTKPNNQKGILYMVNVTAFYGALKIATSISDSSGIAAFSNIPYGNITFVAYAKSDYSQVIGNLTKQVSSESESFNLTCNQNYAEASNNWEIFITASSLSILIIALPLLTTIGSPSDAL